MYLDYTGGGSTPSRRCAHTPSCSHTRLGNPHSVKPEFVGDRRRWSSGRARAVLDYFNAGDDYTAVFTPNATGALKLVGESYPVRARAAGCC